MFVELLRHEKKISKPYKFGKKLQCFCFWQPSSNEELKMFYGLGLLLRFLKEHNVIHSKEVANLNCKFKLQIVISDSIEYAFGLLVLRCKKLNAHLLI